MAASAFLGVSFGMGMLERAALKSGSRFFKNDYTRQLYWMTYLFLFVLGVTLLIKAAIG